MFLYKGSNFVSEKKTMKSHLNLLIVFFLATLMGGCASNNEESSQTNDQAITHEPLAGEALFKSYCYSCHNDFALEDKRVAPPMAAIKQRYNMEHPSEGAFKYAIISYIDHPDPAKALMTNAVQRFGVMPTLTYTRQDLEDIAHYIYVTSFTHPGEVSDASSDIDPATMPPLQRGMYYANSTKAILGKNLMAQIHEKGAAQAVDFCNLKAIAFTDSMATHFGVSIQRVTDLPRNQGNQADPIALEIIASWKSKLANGEELESVVKDLGKEGIQFYAPITTNGMCMQCHGKSDQILPETKTAIAQRYPKDRAIDYGVDQVRGAWSIRWKQ
jgi:mono/diheme cytochrome c family protein